MDARKSARPPSPVPVSMIQSGRTRKIISWYASRSVGAVAMARPSHVVPVHGRLRHTASVNAHLSSSGTGVDVVGRPSSVPAAASAKAFVDMRRGFDRRAASVDMRPTKWICLPGPLKARPLQIGVVLAVAEDARPALGGVGLVGGGAAVNLVEGALADDRRDPNAGRRTEALVELEVGVAAAGDREPLVEAPDLLEQLAADEHAVALPEAVEPIAVADEVTDLEEPVAGVGPGDPFEQPVFVGLVVPVDHRVALLARPDVPLLCGDDGRCIGGEAGEAEVHDAGGHDVRAVDHQRVVATATGADAAVERRHGRWFGNGSEIEIAELGAEAGDEFGTEPLVGIGSVLDDDHLVVGAGNVFLVRARQRVQRARRFAVHVVDDDHDGEIDRGLWGRRSQRRVRATGRGSRLDCDRSFGLAPRHCGRVDRYEPGVDRVVADEGFGLCARLGSLGCVDDHKTADRQPAVDLIEHGAGRVSGRTADAQQCQRARFFARERRVRLPLEEADPVVEELEALEPVAHEVQVGLEGGHAGAGQLRGGLRRRRRAELVGHPDPPVGELVGVEVGAHEDRAPAPAGAALEQVAGNGVGADRVEALLEVIELRASHRGVRQERRGGTVVGSGGAEPIAYHAPVGDLIVTDRVAKLDRNHLLPRVMWAAICSMRTS